MRMVLMRRKEYDWNAYHFHLYFSEDKLMETQFYGVEEFTGEDGAYAGSRFSEVREALFANPYQKIWGEAGAPPLPRYGVTLASVLHGLFQRGQPWAFRQAVARAVDSHADLRWGPDGKGFRRLLHPNGVGLAGLWEITEDTPYSGYFAKGSRALTIGRYSTCCSDTLRGQTRSLSLAGKLYPTADPDHAQPLRTASFFTQQDLGGDSTRYINDAELRNAPDTTGWRRGAGVPLFLLEGLQFMLADKRPSIRQLYAVAELGKPPGEPTRAPEYLRLLVDPGQPRIEGERLDFRDEVMAQIYDRGDPAPKRVLRFFIEVTDQGAAKGTPFHQTLSFENWRRIGSLSFEQACISYNGDCVLHFNHPSWREDRNDPATATRVDGHKRWRCCGGR
jgi:hypothetical protein